MHQTANSSCQNGRWSLQSTYVQNPENVVTYHCVELRVKSCTYRNCKLIVFDPDWYSTQQLADRLRASNVIQNVIAFFCRYCRAFLTGRNERALPHLNFQQSNPTTTISMINMHDCRLGSIFAEVRSFMYPLLFLWLDGIVAVVRWDIVFSFVLI